MCRTCRVHREIEPIPIMATIVIQNLAIIIPEGSIGCANVFAVARWVDVQVDWIILKISGRVYVVS